MGAAVQHGNLGENICKDHFLPKAFCPLPAFLNKVLLEHSYAQSYPYHVWWLSCCSGRAEWFWLLNCLALSRVSLPTAAIEDPILFNFWIVQYAIVIVLILITEVCRATTYLNSLHHRVSSLAPTAQPPHEAGEDELMR